MARWVVCGDALAAVAVSTGAMAQATISGVANFDFAQTQGEAGTFGFGDFDINFAASEDLGGGLKASAAATLMLAGGRTASIANVDQAIALQDFADDNNFYAAYRFGNIGRAAVGNLTVSLSSAEIGTFTFGRVEAGNGIIGRGYAGAPIIGADDGLILTAPANTNIFSYATPSINGLQLSANYTQANGEFVSAGARVAVGASYTNGGVSVGADYNVTSERVRMSASYDMGVAKIGAGYEFKGHANPLLPIADLGLAAAAAAGEANRQIGDNMVVGISAPVGPLNVGAAYSLVINDRSGNAITTEGTSAFEVGAAYNLSKRTSLQAAYKYHNDEATALTGTEYQFRVRLSHSF